MGIRHELAQHVTMRLADSRVIAPTVAARRLAARTFLELADAYELLAFHIVDTHAHALAVASRDDAGTFARRVEGTLSARLQLGCAFERARFTPVRDQSHLASTFRYVLDQARRHGIDSDPLHDASSLPDLVGMRIAPGQMRERARSLLPRFDLDELAATYLPPRVAARVEGLADAAAAAFGLAAVESRGAASALAKHAAVFAGLAEGFALGAIAAGLGLTRRRVEQLRAGAQPPVQSVRAIRLQLRFRTF